MEGLDTTVVWMLGVVAAMVVFGVAAAIGYFRTPPEQEPEQSNNSAENQ